MLPSDKISIYRSNSTILFIFSSCPIATPPTLVIPIIPTHFIQVKGITYIASLNFAQIPVHLPPISAQIPVRNTFLYRNCKKYTELNLTLCISHLNPYLLFLLCFLLFLKYYKRCYACTYYR